MRVKVQLEFECDIEFKDDYDGAVDIKTFLECWFVENLGGGTQEVLNPNMEDAVMGEIDVDPQIYSLKAQEL